MLTPSSLLGCRRVHPCSGFATCSVCHMHLPHTHTPGQVTPCTKCMHPPPTSQLCLLHSIDQCTCFLCRKVWLSSACPCIAGRGTLWKDGKTAILREACPPSTCPDYTWLGFSPGVTGYGSIQRLGGFLRMTLLVEDASTAGRTTLTPMDYPYSYYSSDPCITNAPPDPCVAQC